MSRERDKGEEGLREKGIKGSRDKGREGTEGQRDTAMRGRGMRGER
jgi:hypothetical protein